MRTISRYLTGIFVKQFLLAAFGLVSLFMVQAIVTQILDREFPASHVFIYNLLDIPRVIVQLVPPAVLLATVLSLVGLSRANELIALHSVGVGMRHVFAIIVSLV